MSKHPHPPVLILLLIIILVTPLSAPAQGWREKEDLPEKSFTVVTEVWRTEAKPQGRTGTCWSFSTTSFIETELHRIGRGDFELSEIYTVYHAYIEKARRYLRLRGNNTFGEGGLSHDVIYMIRNYGLVRDSDYSGLLSGETMHNHGELWQVLKGYLDGLLASRGGPSDKWVAGYRAVMDVYLGPIPENIEVDGEQFAPAQFAGDVLGIPFDDYVEITSYSHIPFYSRGELLVPDNWMRYEGYYNIPLDDFIAVIDHALEAGCSLVVDIDVSEQTYSSAEGYAVVDADTNGGTVDQRLRERMFDDRRTTDDHLMHVVGIAKDGEGNKYYLTKDSGGPQRGPYLGHIYLSENYVRAKVLAFMVHKDGLPAGIRARLGIE